MTSHRSPGLVCCRTSSQVYVLYMRVFLLPGSRTRMLSRVVLCGLVGMSGAVVRQRLEVLLAHRAARDLALACCWIKHGRRPDAELSIVLEERPGWGREITESKMR